MKNCKSCDADTMWLQLKTGAKMLVDLPPLQFVDKPGTYIRVWPDGVAETFYYRLGNGLDPYLTYYTSHFATCPDADNWRKNKP